MLLFTGFNSAYKAQAVSRNSNAASTSLMHPMRKVNWEASMFLAVAEASPETMGLL